MPNTPHSSRGPSRRSITTGRRIAVGAAPPALGRTPFSARSGPDRVADGTDPAPERRTHGAIARRPGSRARVMVCGRPVPRRLSHGRDRPHHARPRAHPAADRARGEGAQRPHRGIWADVRARGQGAVRRRGVVLPAARAVADLPRARGGRQGVGRRRQRDVGLPQRLRRDGPGPRAPGDRPRAPGALRPGHPLRRPDGGRGRGRRGARPPLGPAEVALHELRQRIDDGRDPDRPRVHRPRGRA